MYLYLTEKLYNAKNNNYSKTNDFNYTLQNRIYEYTWNEINSFSNQRVLMNMPAEYGQYHNGGKIKIDSKGYLFAEVMIATLN